MKYAAFENRSKTVRMTDLPCTLGNPSMKSSAMSAQTMVGTSNGCNSPIGCNCCLVLLVGQAGANKIAHRRSGVRDMEVLAQLVPSLLCAFVARPVRVT
jgi:hypothetical protein